MKYLCLAYSEDLGHDGTSDEEYLAYYEELRRSGYRTPAEVLEMVDPAATVRMRNGRLAVTDGPSVAGKEQLAGFFLIEARDLNDAIRIAAGNPSARRGSVEVRAMKPRDD